MTGYYHLRTKRLFSGRRYRVIRWPFLAPAHSKALLAWASRHSRKLPWRECKDPFAVLVAEMLLRQTSAQQVRKVFEHLMEEYGSPARMASADPKRMEAELQPLGLACQRTQALRGMAKYLLDHHGGQVPASPDLLCAIPHVGPYAANAVACFAFGSPLPVVDVNVIRVLDRFTGTRTKGPNPHRERSIWRRATQSLSRESVPAYNLALLDLAATVCTPHPNCTECPLMASCAYARSDEQ